MEIIKKKLGSKSLLHKRAKFPDSKFPYTV